LHYWYGRWKHHLSKVDTVVICPVRGGESVVNYVLSKKLNARVIIWYLDPVYRTYSPDLFDSSRCEKWSFDENDCKKYHMKHNTTFYFDNIPLPHKNVIYDVSFVGHDKGRRKEIEKIEQLLVDAKCKTDFYIVDDDASKRTYKGGHPQISYEQILERIAESKALLDMLQEHQTGLTIRPMEALFFKKKLITNQTSIKEQDFYHPNNIFVLGIDDVELLPTFLQKPYYEIPENIVKNYDFVRWIHRFA
jgi:hypothetical protein